MLWCERRAFGKARRPRGVLDVDGVVELQRRLNFMQLAGADLRCISLQCLPAVFEHERLTEVRTLAFDLGENRAVVGLPEACCEDQEADT